MNRVRLTAFVLVACLAASTQLSADIRSDQKVKFQLGGAIGKLVNMFSKGAREGSTSVVAVKGNRKATFSDTTGQIVDLSEEKVYDLDMKKKTYKVTTFAQIRKEMEDAKREAEKNAREAEKEAREEAREGGGGNKPAEKDPNAKEVEVDFDVKNTGATKSINGFNTRQSIVTITVREKGKTLDQSGGMVMVTDLWLAPNAPSTKELMDFEMKYAEKIYGPMVIGASAQDMAMAMAMYPQIKPALDKMKAEGGKMDGTAILTEMRMEAVPPGAANTTAAAPAPAEPARKGLGGMLGGLKKMAEGQKAADPNAKPQRAMILSTTIEMLKLTTDVDAASVALPAGFREDK